MSDAPLVQGEKILITGVTGNLGGAVATAPAPSNNVWGMSLLWEADAVRLAIRALDVGQHPPLVVNPAGQEQGRRRHEDLMKAGSQ